jgi:hypothetical protein
MVQLGDGEWDRALEVGNFVHTFRDLMQVDRLDMDTFAAALQWMEQVELEEEEEEEEEEEGDEEEGEEEEEEEDDAKAEGKSDGDGDGSSTMDVDVAGEGEGFDQEQDAAAAAKAAAEEAVWGATNTASASASASAAAADDDDDIIMSTNQAALNRAAEEAEAAKDDEEVEQRELNAEAELDALQLSSLQFVLDDLHCLLELTDSDESGAARERKNSGRVGIARLPLNQVVFVMPQKCPRPKLTTSRSTLVATISDTPHTSHLTPTSTILHDTAADLAGTGTYAADNASAH